MPTAVISYAHQDRAIVLAVVKLMRLAVHPDFKETVFWDEDFQPGLDWFGQFCAALDDKPVLYVFRCCHSVASRQVQREVEYAERAGCVTVPVLIDRSVPPPSLHAVDLRHVLKHRGCRAWQSSAFEGQDSRDNAAVISPLALVRRLITKLDDTFGTNSWDSRANVLWLLSMAVLMPVLLAFLNGTLGAILISCGIIALALHVFYDTFGITQRIRDRLAAVEIPEPELVEEAFQRVRPL